MSFAKKNEADFYATEPRAVELLLAEEKFTDTVYEPACGAGHISEVLLKHGYRVMRAGGQQRCFKSGIRLRSAI